MHGGLEQVVFRFLSRDRSIPPLKKTKLLSREHSSATPERDFQEAVSRCSERV